MDRDNKEIFDYFDKDEDGKIDLDDIDKICQVIGLSFEKEENLKFLNSINPAFTKKMNLNTFEELMDKKLFPEMTSQDLYNAFRVFDKHKTGRINTHEFEEIMKQVNKQENLLTGEEISKFLKLADPKEEGFIDYDFFIKTLN